MKELETLAITIAEEKPLSPNPIQKRLLESLMRSLADVKGITLSRSRHLACTLQSNEHPPGFAVQKRQQAVHTDVKRHLKKLDDKYNGAAPGGGAALPAAQGAGAARAPSYDTQTPTAR